jgi:hypothetical protein
LYKPEFELSYHLRENYASQKFKATDFKEKTGNAHIGNLWKVMVGLRVSIVPIGAACVCWGRGQVLVVAAGTRFAAEHLIIIGGYSLKQICSVD